MSTASIVDSRAGSRSMAAMSAILAVTGFVVLTAMGAHARFPLPFTPVPVTMQVFVVILAGLCLTPRQAFASQAIYVIGGLSGLPLLAHAGLGTIGYLVGFVAAAPLVSFAARRGFAAVGGLAGVLVIHVLGCAGLAASGVPAGLPVIAAGSLVFLPGDILKVLLAVKASRMARKN
ncbi:MAG TPA: biotin transporter BioY [Myxococcota bacterium]|nr:biotin transporter BioY [Myxococcota bacterium]HNZ03157.1 biotin transporter BioY [Myxococcota bacterium]HOH77119.1 biotin transporter BioY [Myxococcota bacterium]